MGNFSVSHFSGIHLAPGTLELRYILDMAEIPTFQEMQVTGIVADPRDPRVTPYLAGKAEALSAGLLVMVDGHPLALETVSEDVIFPAGAGGLPTMKIGVVYRARLSDACAASSCTLDYRDTNLTDRAGWKEIVVRADAGLSVRSSTAPATSRSQELANYPTDLINSPPQDLSAQVTFVTTIALPAGLASTSTPDGGGKTPASKGPATPTAAGSSTATLRPNSGPALATDATPRTSSRLARTSGAGGSANPKAVAAPKSDSVHDSEANGATSVRLALKSNAQGTPRNRFTELIASNQWGFWFLLTAALIAAALGGLHALEPGHGKTIVAAYLVGSQGTAAHALWLGLVVTVTHTAGVYALGFVTLYLSKYIVPDHLYPWLGVTSGLTIAALGLYMLRRRILGHVMGHSHGNGGDHHHHGWFSRSHSHGHEHHHDDHAGHDHSHSHHNDHDHHHHDHPHDHHHEHGHDHPYDHAQTQAFSYRQLIALGVTGGIVPCPAALVVLLSAVSLHRVAFGLYLILAFSLGLAAVLISIGLVTVYARRLLARVPTEGAVITRWLPMASAAVITCLGVAIVFQGLLAMGLVHFRV
jgi:nickel/cobalt exporter